MQYRYIHNYFDCCFPQGLIHIFFYLQVRRILEAITQERERERIPYPSMITKCMLRVGSSMTSNEANLTSGGACSEFSDSSSSVSTDELPPTFGSSNRAGSISSGGGLLALVTTAPATTTNGFGSRSRLLHIGGGVSSTSGDSGNLFSNDTTMISLMEASDCDDFTGK